MDVALTVNKNKWIENFARFGYAAKGIVYCLVGILACIAAFGSGKSNDTSKTDALKLIQEQPFGKTMLALVALGLLGYVLWRFIEAVKDPHHHGTKAKGILTRIGYGISALIYLGLSIFAFKLVINGNNSGGEGNTQQNILNKVMDHEAGLWIIGMVALIIIGKGIYHIIRAVRGKYRKDIREEKIDPKYRNLLIKAGGIGYFARGIVWGIIGYLLLRAALNSNPNAAGGTENALSFVENGFGSLVLAIIALGLICYGIFKILEGMYKKISVN